MEEPDIAVQLGEGREIGQTLSGERPRRLDLVLLDFAENIETNIVYPSRTSAEEHDAEYKFADVFIYVRFDVIGLPVGGNHGSGGHVFEERHAVVRAVE